MIKLSGAIGNHTDYGTPSVEHMAAAAAALTELAALASTESRSRKSRTLHVRLSHFEHGGFLSIELFGFSILPTAGHVVSRPIPPLMETSSFPPAHALLTPDACSADNPLIHAIVANHPVGLQIENALTMLSSLLARQELISTDPSDRIANFDLVTAEVDTEAVRQLREIVRATGWRTAAQSISARSKAAGLPLRVVYDPLLLDRRALAERAPILRHVYNEMDAVREAVDKTATMLSQGLVTSGGGSQQVAAYARDTLDIGANRTYFAHLARDAFVCGNGYLSFGNVPDEDIKLLVPECSRIIGPKVVEELRPNDKMVHMNVLHTKGAEQLGSDYGISILEPFVQHLLERQIMQDLIDIADAWNQPSVRQDFRESALAKVPMARRALAQIDKSVSRLLGGTATIRAHVPSDLYFADHKDMRPAAAALTTADRSKHKGSNAK